jgi:2-oxoglutarate dehydrogenase E2 component (dihydrolipoamide succinyltransferase)
MADLVVPPLGESITEAVVAKWLKNVGDAVAADEPVAELETDKITVQLPAPVAGVLAGQTAAAGATVRPGDVIGVVDAGKATATAQPAAQPAAPAQPTAPAAQPAAPAQQTAPAAQPAASAPHSAPSLTMPATPSAMAAAQLAQGGQRAASAPAPAQPAAQPSSGRQVATQAPTLPLPTQLAAAPQVPASAQPAPTTASVVAKLAAATAQPGGNGESLEKAALLKLTPSQRAQAREVGNIPHKAPAAAPAPAGPSVEDRLAHVDPRDEVVAMSPLRKRVAERLVQAQHEAASLTTFNEVDMTAVMALRTKYKDGFEKTHGVKLGFMSFFVKACVAACKLFPGVNAEVIGGNIVYKKHYDFGIAVSTPKGLVVPVLRGCDALSFAAVEQGILTLAEKARTGKLALDDLSGGTFSITNGGIYGSMMSTPLLNYPQTGILGMHNIVKRAVVIGDAVEVRPMMYVALSYDHRVVDGREAVSFLVAVKDRLEAPDRMMLEL